MQPKYEVANVLCRVNIAAPSFCIHQQKTLRAIAQCRTAALGGHADACSACGNIHISYNSCRNRHCPKCRDISAKNGYSSVKPTCCHAPTIRWCLRCHRKSTHWHCINLNWCRMHCLHLHGLRCTSLAAGKDCSWV